MYYQMHCPYEEKFEDANGPIRGRKSKNNRQYRSQRKTDKMTNNILLSTAQKTKDRATRTPQKTWGVRKIEIIFHNLKLSSLFLNVIVVHSS